jgi:hypothetical protein
MKPGSFILLIIMGIASLQVFPQSYDSLVTENAQWKVILDSDDPPWADEMSGWLLRGDTIINNLQYKKLYSRSFEEAQSNIITSQNLYGFLREDATNKRVYALESQNGGCDSSGTEYLLFDFSYEVGDTSQLCIHTEELGTMVLEQKYSMFTFGKERNIFSFGGWAVELIEGVGHFQGLMESPVVNISGGPIIYLFDYCRGTDEECNVIYVKVVENPYNNYFSIYPNPADDRVRVRFFDSDFHFTRDTKISLTDVYGRGVKEIISLDDDMSINVSDVPNGLYFVGLIDENRVIATRKLFVAR